MKSIMKHAALFLSLLALAPCGRAQSDGPRLTFDVASVKPASFPRPDGRGVLQIVPNSGGPGTTDPGRIHYPYISLRELLRDAFQVKDYQIEGPDFLAQTRFDISATLNPATTKAEFRIMLQNLLADRFGLVSHRDTRDVPIYSLVVAKGGAKLKPAAAEPPPDQPQQASNAPIQMTPARKGDDGFPAVSAKTRGLLSLLGPNGQKRIVGFRQTMQDLAEHLTLLTNRVVVDNTGMPDRYDILVNFSDVFAPSAAADAPPSDALPNLFQALQSQLGLKLEPGRGRVEMLVIDHIEKSPAGN